MANFKFIHAYFSFALIVSYVLSGEACAQGTELKLDVFGVKELRQISDSIKNFKRRDQFDVPPKITNITGRQFLVDIKPLEAGPNNMICAGSPMWGYDTEKGEYNLHFRPRSMNLDYADGPLRSALSGENKPIINYLSFISFACKHVRGGSYVASNGYGALATIDRTRDYVLSFSVGETDGLQMEWKNRISGDVARKLSASIRVRLSGTIGTWPDGQNVLCGIQRDIPRFDWPYDETIDACVYKAESLLIEVVDGRSGSPLYSLVVK